MTLQTRFLSGSNPIVIDYLREHRSPEELKGHVRTNELILRKGVDADQEIDQNSGNYSSFADLWLQAEWVTSNTNPQLNFQDYAALEAKRTVFFVQRQAEWIRQEIAKYPQATQKTARYIQKQADARLKEECDIWRELFWHSEYSPLVEGQRFYSDNLKARENCLWTITINTMRCLRNFDEAIRTSEGSISEKTYRHVIFMSIPVITSIFFKKKAK